MTIANPLTVLIATVLAGPALWRAFVVGDLEPGDAAIRFLIAMVVAAAMQWAVRGLANGYKPDPPPQPRRRTNDQGDDGDALPATEGEIMPSGTAGLPTP
jgi:hypothetical protein